MKVSRNLSSGLTLAAEVVATLQATARLLLERLVPQAVVMHAGETTIAEIEWARFRLEAVADMVTVSEPDYLTDADRFVPSITLTSRLFAVQAKMLDMLGLTARPLQPGQYIWVSAEALEAASVIGQREDDADPLFSGWTINATAPASNSPPDLCTTSELVALRPLWFAVLALPPGWLFRVIDDVLVDCELPDGRRQQLGLPLVADK